MGDVGAARRRRSGPVNEPESDPAGPAMGDAGSRQRVGPPLPDALIALEERYAETLALFDSAAAIQRMVATVPLLTGVDVAWVGEPDVGDQLVLQHSVNAVTGLVDGLVVPTGIGLGGKVLATRRPLWVSNYCTAQDITDHFKQKAGQEGLKAMIAVPILRGGQFLGVLYGANRYETQYGDRTALALEHVAARTATAQLIAERARHAAEVAVHEERRRLALELHDTVGAMLFTIGAGIRRLGVARELDEETRIRVSALERQAAEAAEVLRGSLRVLSVAPEQVALPVALREHCRAFQERTGVVARMITLTDLPALPGPRVRALTDAVREALLNVEKHAQARSVVVSTFASRNGVAVAVCDDGVGFTEIPRPAGLGLASMSDRLARVGGAVDIALNDDGGITVQAWVPA